MELVRQQALRLLERREHSRHELKCKLALKGWQVQQIDAILDELAANRCQDDERFLQSYIRYRREAGYGPRRILAELAERGIQDIPVEAIDESGHEWLTVLAQVWQKKFKNQRPKDLKTKAKQMRFLVYRGFPPDQVQRFLNQRAGESIRDD